MASVASLAVGFVAGWLVRASVESAHEATVLVLGGAFAAFQRLERLAAIERDRLEDLMAEARARADLFSARRSGSGEDPLHQAVE
jgi:hypothetical protein